MGLTIIPSMPGETLGLLVGPGGSGAAMMFPFWKALHRLRGVSPLWHSEMVTLPVSLVRFAWCRAQSTSLVVSLWGAMYVIVNRIRLSPSQVQQDPAIRSLLVDFSRRLSSGTLV
jgi:hypothetical protein